MSSPLNIDPPVSGGEPHLPDFLKDASEPWLWRKAHGSISVQEWQPDSETTEPLQRLRSTALNSGSRWSTMMVHGSPIFQRCLPTSAVAAIHGSCGGNGRAVLRLSAFRASLFVAFGPATFASRAGGRSRLSCKSKP